MLEVSNVRAGYGGVQIVHDVSFRLEPGENLCILGANGCGKTTLLRAIGNIIPFSGSVKLNGVELSSLKRRKIAEKIAMLSQISTSYFSYTVYDTVMLGRYQHIRQNFSDRPGKEDRRMVENSLETVGMLELADARIDEISGGQLQRVFLAKTLAQDPQIILLDEPTNHLDMKQQAELLKHLKKWSASGEHSVIGVFHDINLAVQLADKVLFMKEGRKEAFGSMDEIISSSLLKKVYEMDVAAYMNEKAESWERLSKLIKKNKC